MTDNKYKVRLDNFEGPMDLLLHLIEKNEIDIYDIPIAQITDQYLYFVNESKSLDLDFASEFLVMAATLLTIKAKMLLPKPPKNIEEEEGEDPRDQLVARLLEYKQYKTVAKLFRDKEAIMAHVFTRKIDEADLIKEFGPQNPVEDISLDDLLNAFQIVLEKATTPEPVFEVKREEVSIQECMVYILESLKANPLGLAFKELFPPGTSRLKIIVTFLGLLELIKMNKIRFRQSGTFGKIIIFLRQDPEDIIEERE